MTTNDKLTNETTWNPMDTVPKDRTLVRLKCQYGKVVMGRYREARSDESVICPQGWDTADGFFSAAPSYLIGWQLVEGDSDDQPR